MAPALRAVVVCVAMLCVPTIVRADPAWMAAVEAQVVQAGQGPAALSVLAALPLPERQTQDYHWMLARAAHAADRPDVAAEAVAVATLLLPGPVRDLTGVKQWLATRGRQLQARALGTVATAPAAALASYLAAVKADGAVLADDDRGLRGAVLRSLRAAADAAPADARAQFELGWHAYFQGEDSAARAAFSKARDADRDPYGKWRSQLWVDRLDRESASAQADDRARDARIAAEREVDDKRRAAEDKDRAARQKKEADEAAKAQKQAARERRHQITLELIDVDARIRTLRERRMIRLTPGSGLAAQGIYNYLSELKEAEDVEQERRRKLIEERDALP